MKRFITDFLKMAIALGLGTYGFWLVLNAIAKMRGQIP